MATPRNPTNEAILAFLKLSWNQEVEKEITAAYGPGVAGEVKELYQYAVHRPVDWARETHDQATARVAREIQEVYPYLTTAAAQKLAKCFWFVWR